MIWDDLVEKMLKKIATELGLRISNVNRDSYILSKDDITIGFTYFVNKEGKLKILMSPRGSGRPIDFGDYTMEDLKFENSNARKVLTVRIREALR